jgi:hypothetical protein
MHLTRKHEKHMVVTWPTCSKTKQKKKEKHLINEKTKQEMNESK